MSTLCPSCAAKVSDAPSVCPQCTAELVVGGRYRLAKPVRGAAGVFRAIGVEDRQDYAVQVLLTRDLPDLGAVDALKRNAELLGGLSHSGLPELVELVEQGEGANHGYFLVTRFVWGQPVGGELAWRKSDPNAAIKDATQLLDLLGYLHGRLPRLVHGRLHPRGLLRRRSDARLLITDLSQVWCDGGDASWTPPEPSPYLAPEVAAGAEPTPAADVYSVGVLLASRLACCPAEELWDGESFAWRDAVPDVAPLVAILEDMLALDPSARAEDAQLVRQRLIAAVRAGLPSPGQDLGASRSSDLPAKETAAETDDLEAEAPEPARSALELLGRRDSDSTPSSSGAEPKPPDRDSGHRPSGTGSAAAATLEDVSTPSSAAARSSGERFGSEGGPPRKPLPDEIERVAFSTTLDESKRLTRGGWLTAAGAAVTVLFPFLYKGSPLFFAGVVAAVFGIQMIAQAGARVRLLRRAWHEGRSAVGYVVEVTPGSGGQVWTVAYQYVALGRSYDGRSPATQGVAQQIQPGQEVEVIYLPEDPAISMVHPLQRGG